MTNKDYHKHILALLSELSAERIEWLKDVAWNLARVTRKYDRISVNNGLSLKEKILLMYFEAEEHKKWAEEINIETENIKRELEEEKKKHEEFIRSIKKDRASSSIKYLFPIGEA